MQNIIDYMILRWWLADNDYVLKLVVNYLIDVKNVGMKTIVK
jgi:hypothetical protein